MNIDNEARNYLIDFLKKVLDQSYTRSEWEKFSYSVYQNEVLEKIRSEIANTISKNLQPNGFEIENMSPETRESIQTVISELERISI